MNPVAGGTGPELKYNGSPVTTGEFGGYAPIGAEQTSTGYEVAWKNASTNQYIVWATDSSGNFTTNLINATSRTSPALESIETTSTRTSMATG